MQLSGPLPEAPGDSWQRLDALLRRGGRGLPGGSSLAQLLARRRRVRNPAAPPPLSIRQILKWADAHHRRTGTWPKADSGPIPEAPGETWTAVAHALQRGTRSLSGHSSLARLLAAHRGVRYRLAPR